MTLPEAPPLIVTAVFDPRSANAFQALRDSHFPAALNIVPAHCTLFHHLPGGEQLQVARHLAECCRTTAVMPFSVAGLRFLGRGVALELDVSPLAALRTALAAAWRDWLTPQDRQGFRAHVTVQNKVAPDEARALHGRLAAELPPLAGTITGLALWHYRGGPWADAGTFAFGG